MILPRSAAFSRANLVQVNALSSPFGAHELAHEAKFRLELMLSCVLQSSLIILALKLKSYEVSVSNTRAYLKWGN
jgi:hypothetical protein